MKRGTTPTHAFTIPIPQDQIKELEITYQQKRKNVLTRHLSDCELVDGVARTTLTQEDTFLFEEDAFVEIQLRILTHSNKVFASDIMRICAERILSDEVLE